MQQSCKPPLNIATHELYLLSSFSLTEWGLASSIYGSGRGAVSACGGKFIARRSAPQHIAAACMILKIPINIQRLFPVFASRSRNKIYCVSASASHSLVTVCW
jgi:hypothetical protein